MDIKIPKTTIRYTAETMAELTSLGLWDDSDLIREKMKTLQFTEKWEEVPVKTIGMWMSGGADSSMCAYLLNKKIRDENLDVKFQPMSVRRGRGWNPVYAGTVIDFIENALNIKMNDHIIYYPDINDYYQREIKEFRDRDVENFNNGTFQIMYSGISCNPPKSEVSQSTEEERDEDNDRPVETRSGFAHYINPFFDMNKRDIAKLYDEHDLTHTMFPLTRSCEGSDYESGNYTWHCGKCWWCEERMWAFGFLDKPTQQFIYD